MIPFHNASAYCYTWLKEQPNVKEKSLTEWLLFDISRETSNVIYKTFTENEERLNDSIWECWILTQYCAYRVLIQANKLKSPTDNSPRIPYSNKNDIQIELLLREAQKRNALPLYAFYSCCAPDIDTQYRNIRYISDSLLRWCKVCKDGCFLTSAITLYNDTFKKSEQQITAQKLVDSSLGLSVLDLICFMEDNPNTDSDSTLNRLLTCLDLHFKKHFALNKQNAEGIKYGYSQLPPYVHVLINRNNEDLSWLETKFKQDVENLSGVAIIDTARR